jgi:long-chain acyl-CoA synthetase
MNLACWLAASSRRAPTAPALLSGSIIVADYREFARRSQTIAAGLSDAGIVAGDRIGLLMENRVEYLECLFAIWWIGAVAVPINAKLHSHEVSWIATHSGAKRIFASSITAKIATSAHKSDALSVMDVDSSAYAAMRDTRQANLAPPAERAPDDLAWLFYTSGTTGRPKGAMLSHGNLVAMSLAYLADVDQVGTKDAAIYAAPLSHGAGLYSLIHVLQGCRHVVPTSGGFDPDELLALAAEVRNASMFAVPTMVKRLVGRAADIGKRGDGFKTIVYGGAPMYRADILNALELFGPKFVQIYGQGESPMTITALSRDAHRETSHEDLAKRLASVGRAHSCVDVRITGADGNPQPAGVVGEVEVRGLTVMSGYWDSPDATREALRDGWLRTGDLGSLDEDGLLTLTDRSKDVIISGGANIYPREVEEALQTHPAVREVAVIGSPDEEWGEIVVAFVATHHDQSVTDSALSEHCLSQIARFKKPRRIVRVDELPKSGYGKILKTELRKLTDMKQAQGVA